MIPDIKELEKINEGLAGWPDTNEILAPGMVPTREESSGIFNFIHNKVQLPEEIFNTLAIRKMHVKNFQNFITGIPISGINVYKLRTNKFLSDLQQELLDINKVFEKINLSNTEKELFNSFVSKTASILYNMGFSDAIPHAGQVTRKCIVEAYKRATTTTEILQSAMVGWVHDPKVPFKVSWSNLSTHPIIASAIADNVLNQPDFLEKLKHYFEHLPLEDKAISENFTKGIVEALAINNDSEYVLKNGILNRPEWAPGPAEPAGVIDQIYSLSKEQLSLMGINITPEKLAQSIKSNAIKRFEASANRNKLEKFEKSIEMVLKNVYLETGIRGIPVKVFKKAIKSLTYKYHFLENLDPMEVYNQILQGEIESQELIADLSNSLKLVSSPDNNVFEVPKVSGLSLFNHHIEVENASIAALSLEIADPLLLSPHKLLEGGAKNSAIEQIEDFLVSFERNVKFLPKDAQASGRIWQRDLYYSILAATDELTGNNKLESFHSKFDHLPDEYKLFQTNSSHKLNLEIIEKQVKDLTLMIKDPDSWKNPAKNKDFTNFIHKEALQEEKFQLLFETLKKYYDSAAEKSPEMFGLIPIT